ncbi:MAG: hypothetical protein MUC81_11580, partial [Bacteroidia bacterium]|nr:hypothetical protein [Bacteroidia bacterium]
MAQQLVQNGQAFNVLNQYSLNELLNVDPDMAYNALQVMEGSADEGNAIEALEQFSQAQLWQAMLDCMNEVLIQIFTNYPGVTNDILINLCQVDRNSMNEIANDMGYTGYTTLSNQELVDLLVGEGRIDELNNLIKTYFSNQQIVLGTGSSSFSLKNFLLNTYGYGGFLEAIKCYDNEQLKQFLTTGTLSQSLVKTYLIASVYQQFLL